MFLKPSVNFLNTLAATLKVIAQFDMDRLFEFLSILAHRGRSMTQLDIAF